MIDPSQRTLGDLLDSLAGRQASDPALTFAADDGSTETLTYGELADASLRAAAGFARLGVEPGDRVVVQLANCPEAVLGWFGLARLGAIFVPANPALTVRELAHVVSTSGATLAVGAAAAARRGRATARPCRRRGGGRSPSEPLADLPAVDPARSGRARLHLRHDVRTEGRRDHARELRLLRRTESRRDGADRRRPPALGPADLPRERAVGAAGGADRGRAVRPGRALLGEPLLRAARAPRHDGDELRRHAGADDAVP